jgi:undecaprenyl pyrophosphate phosphatase UppP
MSLIVAVDAEGGKIAMARNGIRIAGIVAIVIAALAAIFALLNFVSRHPQRAIGAFVGCAVFLILGIVLTAMTSRKSKK